MPLYDFECPAGHRFEKNVPLADMDTEVLCEHCDDVYLSRDGEVTVSVPSIAPEDILLDDGKSLRLGKSRCILRAKRIFAGHNNPAGMLDHGMAINRDAAREGRYDPLRPSTRVMGSGRYWRK